MRAFLLGLLIMCAAVTAREAVDIKPIKTEKEHVRVEVVLRVPIYDATGKSKEQASREHTTRCFIEAHRILTRLIKYRLMEERIAAAEAKEKKDAEAAKKKHGPKLPPPKVEVKKEKKQPDSKGKAGAWIKEKKEAHRKAIAFARKNGLGRPDPLPLVPVFLYPSPSMLAEVLGLPLFTSNGIAVARVHLKSGTIYLGRPDHAKEDFLYECAKYWWRDHKHAERFLKFCKGC